MSPQEYDDYDPAKVAGNASLDAKARVARGYAIIAKKTSGFSAPIARRLHLVEVDVRGKADEPSRQEARVVCETEVAEDMLNIAGNMHGGCSAFLVDVCSSTPFAALSPEGAMGVSQAINMVYHAPARLGDKLKIVSTTIAVGARVMSARCEIWDTTNHRLVASGVHVKMDPSPPKTSKL
ncbi:Thioesterase/thiol ester dehydrase-isomerase [Dentipellis sp. KUC8613]|nr:Thioesterase/thiol ester dehydrase-isomerase [Dentipellis sp. KUC8613]